VKKYFPLIAAIVGIVFCCAGYLGNDETGETETSNTIAPAARPTWTRATEKPAVKPARSAATPKKTEKTTRPAKRPTRKPVRPKSTKTKTVSVSYDNCSEVRAAGADPIRRGDPGFGSHLDRDGDGIACE
jgi:hypothetical protein